MKPVHIGTIIFSKLKNKYKLNLQGEKMKFSSLEEAVHFADEELKKIAIASKKPLTVTIKDRDNYLSSNLVVKIDKGVTSSEIISRSLFQLENRKYFTAEEIETHLPLRKINANGLARVNLSRARKFRLPFIFLFTLLVLTSIILFAFSAMKINGIGIHKIDILKKLMEGKQDHDIYNMILSVITFIFAVIMIAYTWFIHFKRFEIRKHGTYKNDEWSKLYVNNEVRKQVTITLLSALFAASVVQVVLLHESYVFSIIHNWYVAMVVVTISYIQIAIIVSLLVLSIIKYVLSKRRFVRRLHRLFGLSYIRFLELVKDKEHVKANANLYNDKDLAIRVDGIFTRFPKDGSLAERRTYRLPHSLTREKLWVKEFEARKKIKDILKENN